MSIRTWKEIKWKGIECVENVKKNYSIGIWEQWGYYFAKAIITPYTDIKRNKSLGRAPKPTGDYISRTISKADYVQLAKNLVAFCEKHNRMPNYLNYKGKKIRCRLYVYMFAQVMANFNKEKKLLNSVNVNYKAFYPPKEPENEVYAYFKKVFGDFGDTIDGALEKVGGHGYGYYYDDVYSNKTSIDRMKNWQGVNCTDSCHVFYNILLELIKKGKYKKVECIHVLCRGGDGHVRLRITMNDGDYIYRDPACTLSDNGDDYCNWCMDGELLAVDPDWFMENLHR